MPRLVSGIRSAAAHMPVWLGRLLLLVVCWQAAGIVWLVLEPASERVALAMPRQYAEEAIAPQEALLRWYEFADSAPGTVAGDFSLVAVIAGAQGAAVLKGSDGVGVAVRVGEEIRPGSRLLAVDPDRITIDQAGTRREIALPQSGARGGLVQPVTAPVGGKGAEKPFRITRGQMAAVLRESNVRSWDAGLSAEPGGGIRIQQVSLQPFARLLGFADGDVLKHVNQRPLLQVADISLISHYFGQHTSVTLGLVRKGAAMTRIYEILP